MKYTILLKIATLLAACSVILGAFGAHALVNYVPEKAVESFQRAVYYQFVHALALILLVLVALFAKGSLPRVLVSTTGYLFLLGIVFFSGSIYYITAQKISYGEQVEIATWVRLVTPLGGLSFVFGWVAFCVCSFYIKIEKSNP